MEANQKEPEIIFSNFFVKTKSKTIALIFCNIMWVNDIDEWIWAQKAPTIKTDHSIDIILYIHVNDNNYHFSLVRNWTNFTVVETKAWKIMKLFFFSFHSYSMRHWPVHFFHFFFWCSYFFYQQLLRKKNCNRFFISFISEGKKKTFAHYKIPMMFYHLIFLIW